MYTIYHYIFIKFNDLKFLFKNNYNLIIKFFIIKILVNFSNFFYGETVKYYNFLEHYRNKKYFKEDFDDLYKLVTISLVDLNLTEFNKHGFYWREKNKQTWYMAPNYNLFFLKKEEELNKKYPKAALYTYVFYFKNNNQLNDIFNLFFMWFYSLNSLKNLFFFKVNKIIFLFKMFFVDGVVLYQYNFLNFKKLKSSNFNEFKNNFSYYFYYKINHYTHAWQRKKVNKTQILNLFFHNQKIHNFLLINFQFFFLFFKFFKNVFIPVLIGILFIYFSFFFFKLSAVKTIANWIGVGFFLFWLFSTFNFFIKRYRYGKYTSAIQRFWKRAFMCFWLIEGFLFLIFFYYLLNASGEPYFMYDTFGLTVNHLITIKNFLLNSFLTVLLINLFIFLLINIKYTTLKKNIYLLLIITFIFIYILFAESYQFYYLLNFYVEYIWNLSEDDNIWELDYDTPRTRNKNHYLTLIIVAKFWHYIFIFVSWIFFVMKTLELNRLRYTFLSMNFQNIILFYIMNWLCLYSWLKWLLRRFMDQTYYWFFTSFRPVSFNIIFNDIYLYLFNIFNIEFFFFKNKYNFNFFYFFNNLQDFYTHFFYFKSIIAPSFIN